MPRTLLGSLQRSPDPIPGGRGLSWEFVLRVTLRLKTESGKGFLEKVGAESPLPLGIAFT